jgi:molecular chaperone GrpE
MPSSPAGNDVAGPEEPGASARRDPPSGSPPDGSTPPPEPGEPGQPAGDSADIATPRPGVTPAEADLRRALADAENLRKRMARDIERVRTEERAEAARMWLPVADNLDRALEHAQADPQAIIEGVRAVRDQVLQILAELGYPRRDDRGQRFDPARHEAVGAASAGRAPPGTVMQVVRPGYGSGDRQLRPAQVVVAKAD